MATLLPAPADATTWEAILRTTRQPNPSPRGPTRPGGAEGTECVVLSRPDLPSRRAVAGGLLVAVAVLGTWWIGRQEQVRPTTVVAIAADDIAPGSPIEADDLRWVRLDLPAAVEQRTVGAPEEVDGTVALGPIAGGDLVQLGSVGRAPAEPGARELSFVVERDWAMVGSLAAGDRIDVLVTYGEGLTSQTRRVLTDVVVRDLTTSDDEGLGAARTQAITVAIADPADVLAATNAARAGSITVVRATAATRVEGDGTYRPPGAAASGEGGS